MKFASSRTAIAALALVALSAAASACGDDDDSSDATTPVVPAATEAPTDGARRNGSPGCHRGPDCNRGSRRDRSAGSQAATRS